AAGRGAAAAAVVAKYNLRQGAFSQRIALAYETANAGALLPEDFGPNGLTIVHDTAGTMGNDIAARIPGQFDQAGNEAAAVGPFLYDNRSIMGNMGSLNNPVSAHDHPVAERHVRHFLEIVRTNRPGTWTTVRRWGKRQGSPAGRWSATDVRAGDRRRTTSTWSWRTTGRTSPGERWAALGSGDSRGA